MRRPTIEQLPRLSLALLVAAMGLMAALLLELHSSAQAHRAMAARALRLYAGIAVEELGVQTFASLRDAQFSVFTGVAREVDRVGFSRPLDPAAVPALVREREAACRCRLDMSIAFRFDYADSTLAAVAVTPGAGVLDASWTAELRRAMPWLQLPPRPGASVPGTGVPAPRTPVSNAFSRSPTLRTVGSGPSERLVMIGTLHDAEGTPIVAYGVAVRTDSLLGPMFARVLQKYPLLPGVVHGLPNDSLLAVEAHMPSGTPVFASTSAQQLGVSTLAANPYFVADTLALSFGALRLGVALRPSVAEAALLGEWAALQRLVPLTREEFIRISGNVAPPF